MMAAYGCLLTALGRAKIANAVLTGLPVALTQMAVGDGAGNPVVPSAAQTALVREVYRRTINAMTVAPDAPDTLLVEMVIPGDAGPFVIREVGVFDQDDDLIAISSLPASAKPAPSEGATKDVVIVLALQVVSSTAVTVLVNPNLVIATRTWVDGSYVRLPGNGTTHQLLRKKSNTRNDWEFYDPEFDATNFIFDCIEEPQVLAAGQTTVTFAIITTAGIAVYVENQTGGLERLIRDQDYALVDPVSVELAASYPAGTRLLGVQNAPNGNVTPHGIGALERNENLNDLTSKSAARANLGVAYASQAEAETGSLLDRVLSPLRGLQLLLSRLASQAEAEAGAATERLMSPLRVRQLLDAVIPRAQRGHEVAELGFFYRRSVPADAWLPLQGGTFGPAGSAASVQQRDDCRELYALWWGEFSDAELPVTGGRGASAAADWDAKKPMAIFNDVDHFYRAWVPGGPRPFASLEADALQNITGSFHMISGGVTAFTGALACNGPPVSKIDANLLATTNAITFDASRVARTASETRPKNRNVLVAVHK